MRTINLLLGSSNKRTNNLIEVAVRDVCYELAVVECFRTARLDEFTMRGCREEFDLLILSPTHVSPGRVGKGPQNHLEDAVSSITTIKQARSVPIIAVGVPADQELRVLMAGAENVFGLLFNEDVLKSEVRRVLDLGAPPVADAPIPARPSFADTLARGFERFKQVLAS